MSNEQQKMKLIDWSKVPRGTMTNKGELIAVYSVGQYGKVLTKSDEIDMVELEDLRIVPATRWTYHDMGKCPVPNGLIVDVVHRDGITRNVPSIDIDAVEWWHLVSDLDGSDIIAYRITGVDRAGGFTDDPDEVTE